MREHYRHHPALAETVIDDWGGALVASGRMLRACISESDQVANLTDDTTRLIFLFVLAHADVGGRYSANPRIIKGKVLPLLEVSLDKVMDALLNLDDNELVYLYEADNKPYLAFPGWERHQKVRKDRESHKYPPPSETFPKLYAEHSPPHAQTTARRWPGGLPDDDSTKVSSSQDQFQTQDKEKNKEGADTPVGSSRPASVVDELLKIFNKRRGKLPEAVKLNQKRIDGLTSLIKEHGADEAAKLLADATQCVAQDDFWLERVYGLDNLLADPSRVLEKAEKFRSGVQPLRSEKTRDDFDEFAEYREMGL